ncbi:MAG TPA: hypothetical protein VGR71_12985, partial [Nitrospira sp.]|nr:hypothetical protein [Nitrospira sp.]
CGLKLYWTLLDGHSQEISNEQVSRTILREPDATARFADRVAAPLARRLDPHLTVAVEVVNEPEVLVRNDALGEDAPSQWRSYATSIKVITDAIRSQRDFLVTAGSTRSALPLLWRSAPGLDAIDVHLDSGSTLPSRAEIDADLQMPPDLAGSLPLLVGSAGPLTSTMNHLDYAAIFVSVTNPER